MAEVRQITVNAVSINSPKAKGDRIEANLRSCFAASPIYNNSITDDNIKRYYQNEVLDATSVAGNGFSNVSLNYEGAPNLEAVDTELHNIPSPYMPNPTSPGPGSLNAADKPTYTGEVPDPEFNVEFGSGLGGLTSPSVTSQPISRQGTETNNLLGPYISGRSYPGSDGNP